MSEDGGEGAQDGELELLPVFCGVTLTASLGSSYTLPQLPGGVINWMIKPQGIDRSVARFCALHNLRNTFTVSIVMRGENMQQAYVIYKS